MISRAFKFTLLGLLIVPGIVGIVALRKNNDRLRERVMAENRRQEESQRLREENERTQTLVSRWQVSEADGARAVHADLLRAREEVATLEKRAALAGALKPSQNEADAEALRRNRDPEKGAVLLENFQKAGQSTPSAAFQTLVWAVMKGDEPALVRVVALSDSARVEATAWLESLPESDRAKWSPEKLAALFITAILTEVPALQIKEVAFESGGQKAIVSLYVPQAKAKEGAQRVPMQLGPGGWQVIVSEQQIERMREKILGGQNLPTPK
jgi:hypothetical protein